MQKARGLTLPKLGAEAFLRLRRKSLQTYHRALDAPNNTRITDRQLALALKDSGFAQVAAQFRAGRLPCLTAGLAELETTATIFKQVLPEALKQTIGEAEAILDHRIRVFNRALDFGATIDWHSDPETLISWPLLHHTRLAIVQGKGSDARAVWELNRLHHFVALGRAYALTKDERYTGEFIGQLTSWGAANPPRFGINWTVAMEAGIRAVNLIAALQLFRASPLLTDAVIESGVKTLLAHGRYIRAHLEFSHRVSSNHYLSDLIGLFVIGLTLPFFTEAGNWVEFSIAQLLNEWQRQVLEDGVDFEASTSYHRLVVEIFLLFYTLSQASQIELPADCLPKLEAMFDFVCAYVKPDGEAPLLGDCDDGRLLKFAERPSADHSYLLAIAAVLFNKEKFKLTPDLDQEALWWFGAKGLQKFEQLTLSSQPPGSQGFNRSQIFIQRQESLYAIIDCGDHGARGRGSHAHSDALSFELAAYGQTFLRDPGTYVYTASKPWRHLFRSTAYHNTARIDRQEISEIDQDQPFALGANVLPKINLWQSDAGRDVLDAEHYGYHRLARPVTHRRILTFDKGDQYWLLEDHFTGTGLHLIEIFFTFDAGVTVFLEENRRVIARGKTSGLALVPIANLPFEQGEASTPGGLPFAVKRTCRWVSPSYRTRLPSSGIIYRLRAEVPCKNVMLLIPFRSDDEARVLDLSSRLAAIGE